MIVFTLYMIPDPATTPLDPRRQVWFGLTVAAVYGLLQVSHIVFGLFIALFLVCALRGAGLYLQAYRATGYHSGAGAEGIDGDRLAGLKSRRGRRRSQESDGLPETTVY